MTPSKPANAPAFLVNEGPRLYATGRSRHRSHLGLYSAEIWGPNQADRYTDEIRDACHALAAGRKTGRLVDIRPVYLKYTTGSHIIYVKDQMDRREVIRILHSRQDVVSHLQAGE
ncbi:MAG: type II toxin-antitoxin system RelE/ParE family toxin [Pseudomonadota bacterium]